MRNAFESKVRVKDVIWLLFELKVGVMDESVIIIMPQYKVNRISSS